MHKPYDEKKAMIEELRGPFTIDMVLQEINRYADSEFRYSDRADDDSGQRHHPPRAPARKGGEANRRDEGGRELGRVRQG